MNITYVERWTFRTNYMSSFSKYIKIVRALHKNFDFYVLRESDENIVVKNVLESLN